MRGGSRPNDEVQVDGEWVGACDPAWDRAYRDAMADLVRRLGSTGAPVALGTIARTSANVNVAIADPEQNIACADRQLGKVVDEVEGTSLLDFNELVCPDPAAPCLEELDGDQIRPDGIHYSDGPAGAAVAHWALDHALEAHGLQAAPPG